MGLHVSSIFLFAYTEKYSSGDVCERCLRHSKRAIRSGSGRNLASLGEQQISGTATGSKRRADSPCVIGLLFIQFNIFYGEVLKWSKRRDSKSRRTLTRRVGSNPTFSARKKHTFVYQDKCVLFSTKSAFVGINPLTWMKSLRDEILLRKVK